jgi:hypothetical protein
MRVIVKVSISAVIIIGSVLIAASFWVINAKVEEMVAAAISRYDGDPVACLERLALDESAPYVDRNDAIYALGQIGSKRSLPVLRSLDVEIEQEKPWDRSRYIVQYEVEKAIRQINSSLIVTRWMYREYR